MGPPAGPSCPRLRVAVAATSPAATHRMTRADATFGPLVRAIIADDRSAVSHLLETSPEMAGARLSSGATRAQAADYFVDELGHYLYAGDTPLHVTAVGLPGLARADPGGGRG